MPFKVLDMDRHYADERTEPKGERERLLGKIEVLLQKAYKAADDARQDAAAPRFVQQASVREMAASFNRQAQHNAKLTKANEEVIRIRQWIHRQNGMLTPGGKIMWEKSGRKVLYDEDLARQNATRIAVVGGRLQMANGLWLDTQKMVTAFSGPGHAIYVLSAQGNLHVGSHSVGERHHSSLLAGAQVAGAGELVARNGTLTWISNKSGHYKPQLFEFLQTLSWLYRSGVPLTFRIAFANGHVKPTPFSNMSEFLRSQSLDDASLEALAVYAKWHELLDLVKPQGVADLGLKWDPTPDGLGELDFGGVINTRTGQRLGRDEIEQILQQKRPVEEFSAEPEEFAPEPPPPIA